MGRTNRRRQQRASGARQGGAGAGSAPDSTSKPLPGLSRRAKPPWRETLDAWGGLPVLAAVVIVIGGLLFMGVRAWPTAPSDAALMGEDVPITSAAHVASAAELQIEEGVAPAGGPHFAQPLRAGIYGAPVEDGNAIHSLEHGMLWITYRADLISEEELEALNSAAQAHSADVVLSPRPQNEDVATITSWGQRMTIDTPVDEDRVLEFITTNRDRSPEPGIR